MILFYFLIKQFIYNKLNCSKKLNFAWCLEGKSRIESDYTYMVKFDEDMAPTPFSCLLNKLEGIHLVTFFARILKDGKRLN